MTNFWLGFGTGTLLFIVPSTIISWYMYKHPRLMVRTFLKTRK